jgi:hypothetical protein
MSSYNQIAVRVKNDVYNERRAGGALKPGHLLKINGSNQVVVHAATGGKCQRMFARENSLLGDATGAGGAGTVNDAYASADLVPYSVFVPGDIIQARLKIGESVDEGDFLVSGGDGSLIKAASSVLLNNVAASTAVTNTTTETTFSNGTITIPANTLKVGDLIRVRGQAVASSTNSTDTLLIKGYVGSTNIFTTGAVDVANGDIATFDFTLVVRTIGASGTVFGLGTQSLGVPGTVTAKPFTLGSTTVDTTAAVVITVKATWSVASASNIVALQALTAEVVTAGNTTAGGAAGEIVAQATEAVDNSAGSAEAFLRVEILP